jgi:hypothetical protein
LPQLSGVISSTVGNAKALPAKKAAGNGNGTRSIPWISSAHSHSLAVGKTGETSAKTI